MVDETTTIGMFADNHIILKKYCLRIITTPKEILVTITKIILIIRCKSKKF